MSNSLPLTDSLDNSDTEKGSVSQEVAVLEPEDTPSSSKVELFPEGGTRGWLTICGAVLVQFTTFGYINSFGAYQDLYVREYLSDYSPSTIGWIGGTQIFLNFSLGIIVGRAFDRGYFRHLMVSGLIFYSLALFMLSLSHKNSYYQVFLTHGVALGLASGLSYVPSLGIASHYFHRRRPLAMGIVSSGAALGEGVDTGLP
ncbi:mycorrhiza-upregulated monocarboxylate permease [Laccaria bicolor S238N-H82]|uniref:Mycorrhiza-upregulated monocarboxylate permease n=1 Tax=Laccaria bicolor (strain S238N-H82 / ATCC MYA-4686) TaxID=486041 RepID=B0D4Y3_LACBS|nr:mycorrhiza-upregulated monocarboxylate permease [Laccaria bicolor S238N-H82]EDR10645.1 mycorrhiza-upregulated monocarboxylate permease [Laccaria bicolor S238N-H82]|eukprot:XP_001879095.1 mycorrhiza-upregulated monocarboxylate permease [Laccaria bicolor S238N-H82]